MALDADMAARLEAFFAPEPGDQRVKLVQGPEGSPNFCFGLYDTITGECVEFVQSDWDYPGLASQFGWEPCDCGATDGTVGCEHKTVSEMLAGAFDWLAARDGEVIEYHV